MKRAFHFVIVTILACKALLFAQGVDVNKLLTDVREALGGEKKLSAITALTVTGQSTRVNGDVAGQAMDFEMAMQLPDKYMKKETAGVINGMALTRTSGFNGPDLIEMTDQPPMMGGGGTAFIRIGGSGGPLGVPQTPEQQAKQRKITLLANRQEFARITLGMFATSFKGYPLTFAYAGQAESPDGKADVVEVKGDGDYAAKFFIDSKTHLPLMVTWMAKEPLVMRAGGGPGGGTVQFSNRGGGAQSPEELMKQIDQQMKEADAKRRVVEFRIYYGNYHDVDGVKVPASLQRSIDGKPTDELKLERVKLNPKIDPSKFQTVK